MLELTASHIDLLGLVRDFPQTTCPYNNRSRILVVVTRNLKFIRPFLQPTFSRHILRTVIFTSGGSRISKTVGANPWFRSENLFCGKVFSEKCMKINEIGPRGGGASLAPPPQGSANEHVWAVVYPETLWLWQETWNLFQESKFVDVLKRVGKVDWKMWKSGKGWAKKREILKEVGEDAFEIGLLIGHRDYRLSSDETADILITFPHQTILEFLGSYGFLHILNEGDSIESLFDNEQERYKVMQYPSFLQFCLSFLEGSCRGEKLKFRKSVYESTVTRCAKGVNFE